MDVSLSGRRVFYLVALSAILISCGDRYDLSTARGRQSRIDDANFHLSRGECSAADEAINPLYASPYVTAEVRLVKASAQACFAHYNLLTFATNIVGASNYFKALALSLDNKANDNARSWLYAATDVITQGTVARAADQRTTAENSYMIFLQFGVISSILRNYGAPDSNGNKTTALSYPGGNMSNVDACALSASFSFISDSFVHADLSDTDSKSLNSSLNAVCVATGLTSCAALNRDRNVCDGVNAVSVQAGVIATNVSNSW